MNAVAHAVRWVAELVVRVFDLLPPLASLTALAVITALLMLIVIRATSPQRLVQKSRDRMAAAIYEMRLFLDAPRTLLAAQARMIGWMTIYLAALLPSLIALAAPLGLLYLHLEVRHGLAPIPVPSTVVLAIELADGVDPRDVAVDPGAGVRVTAPPVATDGELYVRLHIDQAGTRRVAVRVGDRTVIKRIDADPAARRVSPVRQAGWRHLFSVGDEPPPDGDVVRSISVEHPERARAGLDVAWWLYWLGAATVFALLLRRRLGVSL